MRKYTQLDGFSATIGYGINQDEKGYIWIGTDNGGMYFDGKKFRSVLGKYRIPDTEILDCYPLERNRVLLIPLTQKISYFDNDTLITFEKDSSLNGISSSIHNFCNSDPSTKAYWLWESDFPSYVYKFSGRNIKKYHIPSEKFDFTPIINDRLIGNKIDKTGKLYPCIYNPLNGLFVRLKDKSGKEITWNEHFVRGNNAKYLLTRESSGIRKEINVYEYFPNDTCILLIRKIELPLNNKYIPKIQIDRFDNLWLSLTGKEGLYYYGHVKDLDKRYYFPDFAAINSTFVDRNGNLWLSSTKNTLYFISQRHFKNVLLTDRLPLKKEIPKSITGNERGGIVISYTNSSKLAFIEGSNYKIKQLNEFFIEGSRKILAAKNNSFIVFDQDIALYKASTNTIEYIDEKGSYKDICFWGEDDLLAANNQGVKYIASYTKKYRTQRIIFDRRSTSVETLSNGKILIGTPKGLFIKNSINDNALQIENSLLKESNVTDIQSLPGNNALIGTNSYGLFSFSSDSIIKKIGPTTLNSVRSIYRQNDSVYWVSTSNGAFVFQFNRAWDIVSTDVYTFYDGLPSSSVNDVYVYNDTAYMATSEGLGIVPLKDKGLLVMKPPEIYLNSLQIGQDPFLHSDSLFSIPAGQNNISVSLSAISYESLGEISYYYRLYPLQRQWMSTADPEIRYTQLPPGYYEFQAYALNAKGYKSGKMVNAKIYVRPFFWQTVYFKLALSLCILIFIFLLSRWVILQRHKMKIGKIEQKKRLAELELEAIKAQINPHFIYNCLNSIQYLNYQSQHESAQEYLSLFARLIRITMKYAQQSFITISEEIDYLTNYLGLEKLRFKDKLHYQFIFEKLPNKELLLPAMLIQPYVENAIKHAISSKDKIQEIDIGFQVEDESIFVTISDNGPGFPSGKKSGTLGLRLSESRASSYNELFGLDIKIERYNKQEKNPLAHGAIVKIIIPQIKNGNII